MKPELELARDIYKEVTYNDCLLKTRRGGRDSCLNFSLDFVNIGASIYTQEGFVRPPVPYLDSYLCTKCIARIFTFSLGYLSSPSRAGNIQE